MKTTKTFPRKFRSSSAAYRSIRQYEEKMGLGLGESGLVMTKIGDKEFIVSTSLKITFDEFNEKHPNVVLNETTFRYFPDGIYGSGYYELKTGERRRPNSQFETVETVYQDYVSK